MSLRVDGRFWRYPLDGSWEPRFRWLPTLGSDEFGRRTIVVPVPFVGWLVCAYRICPCPECAEIRNQTARWQDEEKP